MPAFLINLTLGAALVTGVFWSVLSTPIQESDSSQGPSGPVFGCGYYGPPRHISFACDVSPSMADKLPVLKKMLGKAVTGLRPQQRFNVTLLQEGVPQEFCNRPMRATRERKRQGHVFIDSVQALSATADPAPALGAIFCQRPNLLYLMVDRSFPVEKVRAELCELNSDGAVRVNVILFLHADEMDLEWVEDFRDITADNRGYLKLVNVDEPEN